MLLTLSGLPGSGTSSVSSRLVAALGVDHVDGGTVFRSMAAERGMSLPAFAAVAESDDSIDRDLDHRLTERARAGDVLVESRLAGWLVTRAGIEGLRIWIHCDEGERARRVGSRDGHDAPGALVANRDREASERLRYLRYYGIDLTDTTIYDLVLDSTDQTVDDLVAEILRVATA